jgi:hypothetical protein
MRTGFTGRKRTAVFAMTGAAAAAITGIGLAGPAGASPASPAAVTGTEHVQIMTTSATSPVASTIVWGPVTAAGVDHMGNTVDTIVFPGGTWRVRHSNGTGPQSFNPKTCLLLVNQHGTFKVLGGTGKYRGISGHGTYKISIVAIGAKVKGVCSQTRPPVAFQQVVDASGPIKLP